MTKEELLSKCRPLPVGIVDEWTKQAKWTGNGGVEMLIIGLIAHFHRAEALKEAATVLLMSAIPALKTLKEEGITIGAFKSDICEVRKALEALKGE